MSSSRAPVRLSYIIAFMAHSFTSALRVVYPNVRNVRGAKALRLALSLLLALTPIFQSAPAGAQRRAVQGQAARDAAALNQLFEEEWEWTMREAPTFASSLGDRRYNDRWSDLSLAAIERRQQHRQQTLARLQQIE